MLSRLWLHEPTAADIEYAVHELGLPRPKGESPSSELAESYANTFLLNVFPYGSAFTDPDGELNSASARLAARAFEGSGFAPRELGEVAAADHLGLCLAFLEGVDDQAATSAPLVADFLDDFTQWAPACCLAVEREPGVHPFYRTLAEHTRRTILLRSPSSRLKSRERASLKAGIADEPPIEAEASNDETRLSDLLRFFLAPARCGVFLSRARLGHIAMQLDHGIRLPFGTRYEVARSLFTAAGEAEVVDQLLDLFTSEIGQWDSAYGTLLNAHPGWDASQWMSRTASSAQLLLELRASVHERR